MKIRFLKTIGVDVHKGKLDEVWDKQYSRWDEVDAVSINSDHKKMTVRTAEGDTLLDVPCSAVEILNG